MQNFCNARPAKLERLYYAEIIIYLHCRLLLILLITYTAPRSRPSANKITCVMLMACEMSWRWL